MEGPPLAWLIDAPVSWTVIPEKERKLRGRINSDRCIIDDQYFFIRGLVEIPVRGSGELFAWGVWVSLSKTNFDRATELWNDPRRIEEPSYFGWLNNSLPGYPETLNLKTAVHSRAVGQKPYIELEPTDHPLSVEQRHGILTSRVQEIAEQMHHHNEAVTETKKWFWPF